MKIYVVQEHIDETEWNGFQTTILKDSCSVSKKGFLSFQEAFDYARQMAFEHMKQGWLISYIEVRHLIDVCIEKYARSRRDAAIRSNAIYTIREINIDL